MTVLTEKFGPGSCLIQEGDHFYSRDVVVVAAGVGVTLPANTVLGQITASKKYTLYNPANSDGSEVAKAILLYPVTGEDEATILSRHCQVKSPLLNWFSGATDPQKTTGIAALAALGIIAR